MRFFGVRQFCSTKMPLHASNRSKVVVRRLRSFSLSYFSFPLFLLRPSDNFYFAESTFPAPFICFSFNKLLEFHFKCRPYATTPEVTAESWQKTSMWSPKGKSQRTTCSTLPPKAHVKQANGTCSTATTSSAPEYQKRLRSRYPPNTCATSRAEPTNGTRGLTTASCRSCITASRLEGTMDVNLQWLKVHEGFQSNAVDINGDQPVGGGGA